MNTKTILTSSAIIMGATLLGSPLLGIMDTQGFTFNSFLRSLPQPPTSTSNCSPAPPGSTSYSCSSTQTSSGGTQSSTQTCYVSGKTIVGSCNNVSVQTSTNSGQPPSSQPATTGGAPISAPISTNTGQSPSSQPATNGGAPTSR